MAWIDNGPVSTPPRSLVVGVAVVVAAAALAGAGMGFRAGWRDGGRSDISADDQVPDIQHATPARPIVEFPTPAPAAPPTNTVQATNSVAAKDAEAAASNEIAVKAAQAQAVQSKPSQPGADIDDILTSASEKPQAPAKPSGAEQSPGGPSGEVPF